MMINGVNNGTTNSTNNGHSNSHGQEAGYSYLHEPGFQKTAKRVIIIGGGFSGIQMAYTLSRKHQNIEFVVCEPLF